MEAAWREGNDGVADFMLQKITGMMVGFWTFQELTECTDNDQRLPLLLPRDRESLASKLLEIGKAVLKSAHQTEPGAARGKYQTAVKWIQKAFAVIEQSEDVGAAPTLGNLKRSILRCLARAYFMSSSVEPGNLDRAEASLNELIDTIDSAADRKSPEHQQLRWMRVAVLKRRKAAESQLLDAFQSIIDHMDFSEECVTEVLQELRTLTQYHILVTSVHRHALQKALEAENDNHGRAMQNIETAFACFNQAEYELPKIQTTACLTLLWQFGNRHYNAKRWTEAAGWFLCGTNQVLASMARASHAKCFRKAALCYIQHGDFAAASAVLRRCPGNEATTYYVVLLTAVRQGLQDPAIKAVRDMVKAPDFDRKMLLLATQLANESDMKPLLLSVLEALLETLANQETHEIHTEAITLIRCIVRLVVKLMGEPGANSSILVPTLIGHLNTAKTLIESFHATKRSTIIAKDVSWLWRTAYNCAVQGCAEWENSEEAVSDLFDIARNLLEVFCASALTDVDPELYVYLTNASFAAVSGKVFALRRRLTHTTAESSVLADISEDIATCTKRIQKVLDGNKLSIEDVDRARSFIHLLRVFDTEVSCLMKDWKHLLESIQQVVQSDPGGMDTFEAIADILWAEKDCPVEVLFAALEAILHASLDRMSLSVEKFARWLRAISTILLARNSTSDRTKAVGYVEQAVAVLEEHSQNLQQEMENVYPMDERQWLLGTSYNTGIECL
ncbi:hypothetical protein EW026_g4602 [Hermanssonia centrifuga]|uniref:Protein ZIP4 homolog n=1 Tax=Hermanssonia centrifuga TaxID=98765 RepID=A0A4S4KGM9_9APHY|nr:hypothetical protein EW026_g4602 [Hermanssonia centrifuga]